MSSVASMRSAALTGTEPIRPANVARRAATPEGAGSEARLAVERCEQPAAESNSRAKDVRRKGRLLREGGTLRAKTRRRRALRRSWCASSGVAAPARPLREAPATVTFVRRGRGEETDVLAACRHIHAVTSL